MKKAAALFLIFGFWAISAHAAEDALFREANEKYQAGDYAASASLYQKSLTAAHPSGETYYNLGNADFRAGHKGRALLDYERARALDPRDGDIDWNENVLKNALPDRIEEAEDNVFFSSVRRLLGWVTIDETAALSVFLLGVLFFISALNFVFHRSKSLTAGLGGFFVFLWLASALVFYLKWLTVKDPYLVVLDKEVTARYGPSDKETKAFVLHEGASAKVLDQTDGWYYIFLQDKNTGWVSKKSCAII